MKRKQRLDDYLVSAGLAENKSKARALVMAGNVYVNGELALKAGKFIDPGKQPRISLPEKSKYVSRGGDKLAGFLDDLDIEIKGKTVVDVGASTGGFTDYFLQHGAARVFAIDVGYGQLAWKLRKNRRVTLFERTNLRYFDCSRIGSPADIVCCDVSFISLTKVIDKLLELLKEKGELIILIKPQFEAGREKVGKGGVVKDPEVVREVVERISGEISRRGVDILKIEPSKLKGPKGNTEYFLRGIKKARTRRKDKTMKTVGIVPNLQKKRSRDMAKEIIRMLVDRGMDYYLDSFSREIVEKEDRLLEDRKLAESSDLIVVLGGDGTFLSAVRRFARYRVPLLGVNLGNLGFLAETGPEELEETLDRLETGNFITEERLMLKARLETGRGEVFEYVALNDVVVNRQGQLKVIHLKVSIDEKDVDVYSGDGLIISTPTGSTGYSLSVGGPIVTPGVPGILIIPISAHTLNSRAILVKSDDVVTVKSGSEKQNMTVVMDGQVSIKMQAGDRLKVTSNDYPARIISFADKNFFELIHRKFKWR